MQYTQSNSVPTGQNNCSVLIVNYSLLEKGCSMTFSVSAALLDAMVLAVVANEETYGYKITQELCEAVSLS